MKRVLTLSALAQFCLNNYYAVWYCAHIEEETITRRVPVNSMIAARIRNVLYTGVKDAARYGNKRT